MGKEEGVKEGIKEASQKIARNMLLKGFSHSEIAEITGLTEEEIRILDS